VRVSCSQAGPERYFFKIKKTSRWRAGQPADRSDHRSGILQPHGSGVYYPDLFRLKRRREQYCFVFFTDAGLIMNEFLLYLQLGYAHISDLRGFDHLLFLVVLCSVYTTSQWKKVALLITAFTLGHSVTLVLSAAGFLVFNLAAVEVLIAVTIFISSIANLAFSGRRPREMIQYFMALLFGCIHGMGFSIFFKSLLMEGTQVLLPLFAFNVGLELGQILIVAVFFMVYYVLQTTIKIRPVTWTRIISSAGAVASFIMIVQRWMGLT
jgi:hypothetical protein